MSSVLHQPCSSTCQTCLSCFFTHWYSSINWHCDKKKKKTFCSHSKPQDPQLYTSFLQSLILLNHSASLVSYLFGSFFTTQSAQNSCTFTFDDTQRLSQPTSVRLSLILFLLPARYSHYIVAQPTKKKSWHTSYICLSWVKIIHCHLCTFNISAIQKWLSSTQYVEKQIPPVLKKETKSNTI